MRRRLTVAILLLVAATLVVTSLGSFSLVRHAALSTAQQELAAEGRTISNTIVGGAATKAAIRREFRIIRQAGNFDDISVVRVASDGSVLGTLPSGLSASDLRVAVLQSGRQVSGHIGSSLVFTAVPTPIPTATGDETVVVATRSVPDATTGLRYFVLVGAGGLLLAAAVAAMLSRRFSRPLEAAAATTARIAAGDLDAKVAVAPGQDAEFTRLAESINAMGANLVRAREQERNFLLAVSHELRTPLTSIRGYADAVVDGAAEDPTEAASVIGAEARRLERLVQDLLDLARLDANRFSLELRSTDAASVAREVVEGFRPRAVEIGLGLELAPAGQAPLWVEADPDRLAQVLANLVENAASFARQRIEVGSGIAAGAPAVWVVDDGPGIPPDQLGRVFERHFVSDRVAGRRKGSGLGLAIVSELAAAMGGEVRAESPV
ncbi:MAG TPA: HAMP domain-containing sensor histidine kinase, partial [Acidimicrobiales bacterium]|nr:HAMP domain-containing sensor histidine kinase [Acidimicrobiales bacterium]